LIGTTNMEGGIMQGVPDAILEREFRETASDKEEAIEGTAIVLTLGGSEY